MSLTINGRKLEITPAIQEYVTKKVARINKRFDQVIDSQVTLSIEPQKHNAEITIRVPGKDIHCEASDDNLYAAIDLLIDKADRLVVKHKEKAQSHPKVALKHQEATA